MKQRLAIAALALACGWFITGLGQASDQATDKPKAEKGEWVELFNGKDLTGWKQLNGTAIYKVEDGAIAGTTAEGSPNSFLCTEKTYGDFELEFDVKVDPRLNSGVQIRSLSTPDYQDGRVHGYQVEIDSEAENESGYIYDEARRGWLSENRDTEKTKKAFKVNDWNHYRIVCQGDRIQTWINDVPIEDLRDSMTPEGFIGLQVHSFEGDSPAQVMWKNIKIREL